MRSRAMYMTARGREGCARGVSRKICSLGAQTWERMAYEMSVGLVNQWSWIFSVSRSHIDLQERIR